MRKTRNATSGSAKRPKAKRAAARAGKHAAARPAKPKRAAPKRAAPKRAAPKRAAAKRTSAQRTKPAAAKRAPARRAPASRWVKLVERHGVVLASARGAVPCVAEAVAGEPIIGSWWAHPKGKAIFAALSELDDSEDVRCFKLIGGKVTFVHRRMWPAIACLATGGVLAAGRVASIQQEHMPTGEHRNLVTPFPDWVSDDVTRAAAAISIDDARALFATWL
jgi:hypothetical protein